MLVAILARKGWDHLHSAGWPISLGVLAGLSVFAVAAGLFLRRALDCSPQVILFKGGVSIQRGKVIDVPWSKVRWCRSVRTKGYKALLLLTVGEFHLPNSISLFLLPLWVLEKRLVGPSVGFPTSNYDMAHSQIKAPVEERIAYDRRDPASL